MKKYFLAPFMIAASGLVAAQSSVSVFGVADAAVAHTSGSLTQRTQLVSGSNSTSRLGFRGKQDLPDGYTASFWLEAAYAVDSGVGSATNTNNQPSGAVAPSGLTLNRRATVSLAGPLGEIRLGRDQTPQYKNRWEMDPFQANGVGTSQPFNSGLGGPTSSRASNTIAYWLPDGLAGVYGFAQYYLGENPRNQPDEGTGGGVRIGYRVNGLNVSLSTAKTKFAQTATAGDIDSSSVGLQYQVGTFLFTSAYFIDKVNTVAGIKGQGAIVGGVYDIGSHQILGSYSSYKTDAGAHPESLKLSAGYLYNFTKQTALYGTAAHVKNRNGAASSLSGSTTAPNRGSTGYEVGLRTNF